MKLLNRPRAEPVRGRSPRWAGAWARALGLAACVAVWGGNAGCMLIPRLGTDPNGDEFGQMWYLGGAGTFGNIGTIDVPKGLRQAGYRGAIEVFGWQSIFGGTIRDQIDRERNVEQARRLAHEIEAYSRTHPGRPASIIALSAGTGITTWALELLPEDCHVGNVIFLSSSLSRGYDLTAALRRVDGRLYNFHSARDPVLRYGIAIAGSVDRETFSPSAAGLYGFSLPADPSAEVRQVYKRRLQNRPYQSTWARWGYRGYHTDSTNVGFVQHIVAPLVMKRLDPDETPIASRPPAPAAAAPAAQPAPTSQAAAPRR